MSRWNQEVGRSMSASRVDKVTTASTDAAAAGVGPVRRSSSRNTGQHPPRVLYKRTRSCSSTISALSGVSTATDFCATATANEETKVGRRTSRSPSVRTVSSAIGEFFTAESKEVGQAPPRRPRRRTSITNNHNATTLDLEPAMVMRSPLATPSRQQIATVSAAPDLMASYSSRSLISQSSSGCTTVEISPGLFSPLRGADETWKCIEKDFFLPTTCYGCTMDICCIQDASFVLCPECRVVSPLEGGPKTRGVGLGFCFDDLFRWQSDIIREQERIVALVSISS